MDQYYAENLVLALADSVIELRQLRKEVEELRKIKSEYYTYIFEQAQASEKRSRAMFEGIMLGVISKPNKEELTNDGTENT